MMAGLGWNPWRAGVIAAAVIVTTAVITGLVVANWNNGQETSKAAGAPPARKVVHQAASARPQPEAPRQVVRTPSQADIQACNEYARSATSGDRTKDVLTKAVIGGALGAGVGAAGGAIAGGGGGAGKGAAIGGIVGATAGTLYGLNQSNQNDTRATEAYRACMRDRGHTG